VRLRCPAGSHSCENQKFVEIGDGCSEDLEQWFSRPAKSDEDKKKSKPEPKKERQMPKQCLEILTN
jgi:penicillin-insensitive murein endopeptidase